MCVSFSISETPRKRSQKFDVSRISLFSALILTISLSHLLSFSLFNIRQSMYFVRA